MLTDYTVNNFGQALERGLSGIGNGISSLGFSLKTAIEAHATAQVEIAKSELKQRELMTNSAIETASIEAASREKCNERMVGALEVLTDEFMKAMEE